MLDNQNSTVAYMQNCYASNTDPRQYYYTIILYNIDASFKQLKKKAI